VGPFSMPIFSSRRGSLLHADFHFVAAVVQEYSGCRRGANDYSPLRRSCGVTRGCSDPHELKGTPNAEDRVWEPKPILLLGLPPPAVIPWNSYVFRSRIENGVSESTFTICGVFHDGRAHDRLVWLRHGLAGKRRVSPGNAEYLSSPDPRLAQFVRGDSGH